jgi:AmmeMemoRadiSam system protein B
MNEFVEAMRETIAAQPGRTLVVSSADLSHVGPAFGDQQMLAGEGPAEQFRNKVFQHDREMLEIYRQGKYEDLIASMSWQQNPTRWCSVGNMTAAMRIVGASGGEILNYGAAMDEQGMSLVSTAAMVLA